MARHAIAAALLTFCIAACAADSARAQFREQQIIQSSSKALDEIMAIPISSIPQSMLADAQGIAILPDIIKAGFVIGGRHGTGVLLVRDEQGAWQLPVFIKLTGGNIGWQAGVQATDLILVFKTQKSVRGILGGKLTIGADAAAAAGPVGRQASAATDERLGAEIYSYSRSRGLFVGVSIDGSVLRTAPEMNAVYYGAPGAPVPADSPAVLLASKVAAYTTGANITPIEAAPAGGLPAVPANPQSEPLRAQVAGAAQALSPLLDASWKSYLALPAEIYRPGAQPHPDSLQSALDRYDRVAQDPQYRVLNSRAEFQSLHDLLKQYERTLADRRAALDLPPPPSGGVQTR